MLQLVLQSFVAAAYAFVCVYHINDILYIPLPFVGLAWVISLRFIPAAVPQSALSWLTYIILVYQLLTFHDLDACLLDECTTDMVYEYIMLSGTAVLWFSMKDGTYKKKELNLESPNIKEPKNEPNIKLETVQHEYNVQPVRLKMGGSLQHKWV